MRDKSGTFLLWHPGSIALRTTLRTGGPDKDAGMPGLMRFLVSCDMSYPLHLLEATWISLWNNKFCGPSSPSIELMFCTLKMGKWKQYTYHILTCGGMDLKSLKSKVGRTKEMEEARKRLRWASDDEKRKMQEVVHIKDYMFPNDIWQSSPERRAGRRKWKKAGADYLRPQTHLLDCQTQKMLHRGGEGPRCEGNLCGTSFIG